MIWDSIRLLLGRACVTDESGLQGRRHGRKQVPARRAPRIVRLVAIVAVGALVLSQCGDEEEPADGEVDSTTTTVSAAPPPAPTTEAVVVPPAPDPLPTSTTAAPAPQPPAPAPQPATAPPPPALSGPPPVAVGVMPDLAIAADGFAHAIFVARFFEGPIERYWAESSDGGVVTAGVSPPDMLIVAPVTNGAASITVTAAGPGGTATQTFTARVGAGATVPNRSSDAQPPAPAPAPSAPLPPAPAPDAPISDDSDVFLPIEELPAIDDLSGTTTPEGDAPDDIPAESLPPAINVTAAPTLSGSVSEQIISAGQTVTVDVEPFFDGVVQGWAVDSSNPTHVRVSMTVAGRVTVVGLSEGISTVTVTAENRLGSVAQAFRVAVRGGSESGDGTAPTAESPGDDAPVLTVSVGLSIRVDLDEFFESAATNYSVSYDANNPDGRVDVRVSGSTATIRGVQAGKIIVTLTAQEGTQRFKRLAVVEVSRLPSSPS